MPSSPPSSIASSRLLPSRSPSCTYSFVREFERRISQTAMRPPPCLGDQPLAHDPLERLREARADLPLLVLGEDTHDAVDGLGRVDRVQRREHQVARLRGLERDRDRLEVAHLAHQDHLGRLAQRGAQREREGLGVGAHLALVDGRLAWGCRYSIGSSIVMMWIGLLAVDLVDDRGQGRGLARSGGPGQQHDAVALVRDLVELRGSPSSSTVGTALGMTRSTTE